MSSLIDFEDLNYEEIGIWPLPIRVAVIIVVCAIIAVGTYFTVITNSISDLDKKRNVVNAHKEDFKEKHGKVSNIHLYRSQMDEINKRFAHLLKQLPVKNDIHILVNDISRKAKAKDIEAKVIKPKREKNIDFHKEQTIELRLVGGYHNIGEFVEELAKLPRIVILHDFKIKHDDTSIIDIKQKGSIERLIMDVDAKTYWLAGKKDNKKNGAKK